jgi:RNA 2',3'-cyclic 3'-phosphodiesterase
MKRLFIGLPLTEAAERGVKRVVEQLQKKHWKVRWEPVKKWHMTLVFLGDQSVDQIRPILHKLQHKPFELKFKGLGRFPEIRRMSRFGERGRGRNIKRIKLHPKDDLMLPKLIYLDLKGDLQRLHKLQQNITAGLRAGGLEFDDKTFRPHLTLGKIRSECSRGERLEIAKEIEKLRVMELPSEWWVDRVCLYESLLKSEGSVYQVNDEVKLDS